MSLTRDKDRGGALDLAGKCHHTDADATSLHGIKVSAMSLLQQGVAAIAVLLLYLHGKHLRSCQDSQLT